ncbi:MAG: DUF4190 domain-containing protein [Verrucomicrobia bacterium]|nr:DUF4190 domain-containing protein [Verrucomicrobiota bacterium]
MQPPPFPPAASPAPQRKTAGIAIASLVLGILSLFCGACVTGIPAIILGIIALVRIGKTPGLGGQGLAIAGLVTGGIGGLFSTGIIAALALPAFVNARERAMEVRCMSNVRQLYVASMAYAQDHDQALPKTLDELRPHLGGDAKTMALVTTCPVATDKSGPSYRIEHAGEKTADLPASETIIITEKECRHRNKRSVGYLDGRTKLQAGP